MSKESEVMTKRGGVGGVSRNLESQSGLRTLRCHVCILIVIDIE